MNTNLLNKEAFCSLIICLLLGFCSFGQERIELPSLHEELSEQNIKLTPLFSDTNSSSYYIVIRDLVKPHYHASHTETIYIESGTATLRLNDKFIEIKAGDCINIPPNTIHSVRVTSKEKLKVLSIQAPQFFGKDRIFVEE